METRRFKTEKAAKTAIKRGAMHLMSYAVEWRDDALGGFGVTFFVHDDEDKVEIEKRRFQAIIDPSKAA
jgi:hypothetical protein